MRVKLRKAKVADLSDILDLFQDTIIRTNRKDYTEAQITSWLSSVKNTERWEKAIKEQYFLIALVNSQLVGFGSLKDKNYLDFLYIHADFQRMGVARKIYRKLFTRAFLNGAKTMISDVSITAKPFFEAQGFKVIQKQENERNGEILVNYRMELKPNFESI